MRLFHVGADHAFTMLRPVHKDAWQARGGTPVSKPWNEVDFTPVDDAPEDFIEVDCLTMNTIADGFLLSTFARDVLAPSLKGGGEFWPVWIHGLRYWWLNCLAVEQALDRGKTDAEWSVVGGAWGSFSWITTTRRLAFDQSRLQQMPLLFRIPEYPQGVLLAGDELLNLVESHQLTGFKFELVWSVEEGGTSNPAGVGLGNMFEPMSQPDIERRRRLARELLAKRRA